MITSLIQPQIKIKEEEKTEFVVSWEDSIARETNLPSLGSMAPIVSWVTGTGDSNICWPLKELKKGDEAADLLESNREIHTVSE